jgi:hypothetical protein
LRRNSGQDDAFHPDDETTGRGVTSVLKSQPRRCRSSAIMARAFYPNRSAEVLHISLIPRAYDVLTRDRLRSFRDRSL